MIRALESCRFAGKNYSVGDTVPASAIDKKKINALVEMKIIEILPDKPKPKRRKKL